MPSELIKTVANYCWSHNFLDVFHKFFADHAHAFETAPEMCSGEHDMEYYSLFQLYLKVYEDTLTSYLESLDCSIHDFYKEVREYDENADIEPYLKTFIHCLLASADYESFYKVMVREGRKSAYNKSRSIAIANAKAESKSRDDAKDSDNAKNSESKKTDTYADNETKK
jgi:hypothetical protein